jgi:hypothetical protein
MASLATATGVWSMPRRLRNVFGDTASASTLMVAGLLMAIRTAVSAALARGGRLTSI